MCFPPALQDLKARLKEEMSRAQSATMDQRSEANKDRTCCELEVTCRKHDHTCPESETRKEVNASQRRCMFVQKSEQISCLTVGCFPNGVPFKRADKLKIDSWTVCVMCS